MNQEENNQKKFNNTSEYNAIEFPDQLNTESIFEENGTFCAVGSEANGILEVDLQSIKQKGVENRSISFAIILNGATIKVDEKENPIKAEMLFRNEKDFEKFKAFIAKLNWND